MTKVKILDIVFENSIEDFEIEAFRGAVSKLVGYENTLFHNHLSDNKLVYAYPLVQYKRIKSKAAFTCIAQGVDEVVHFFHNKDWSFEMSGRRIQLKIDTFQLRNGFFDVQNKLHSYTIQQWQPLNQENYKKFNNLRTAIEKIKFLESIMVGNILSMGKSLNWTIQEKIELSIAEVLDQKLRKFKKNEVLLATDGEKETLLCLDVTIENDTVEYFKTNTSQKLIVLERALDTTKKWNLKHYLVEKFNAF